MQKIGSAIALSLSSWILGLVGYVAPEGQTEIDTQPPSVLLTLRIFFSFVPIFLLFCSMIPILFYQLDRAKADSNIYVLKFKKMQR